MSGKTKRARHPDGPYGYGKILANERAHLINKAEDTGRPDEVWTTAEGKKLLVGEMAESHVRDALRMVIRNHRRRVRKQEQLAQLRRDLAAIAEAGDDWRWGDD